MTHVKTLCIGDESEIEILQLLLEHQNELGIEFHSATKGREGLKLAQLGKPDLIILGIQLPDLDGWEVFQQLKADDSLKNIPVIMLRARRPGEDPPSVDFSAPHPNGVLLKPIAPDELLVTIQRVLAGENLPWIV